MLRGTHEACEGAAGFVMMVTVTVTITVAVVGDVRDARRERSVRAARRERTAGQDPARGPRAGPGVRGRRMGLVCKRAGTDQRTSRMRAPPSKRSPS